MDRRAIALSFALAAAAGCGDETATSAKPAPETKTAAPSPSPSGDAPPIRKDGTVYGESELMGTRVSINVFLSENERPKAAQAGAAMQEALAEMAEVERTMSEWDPKTELSRLNRAAGGDPLPISSELFEVLERARAVSDATDGAFDITFHGVGQLWSFRPGAQPPSREAIAQKLPLVDFRAVELQRDPAGGGGSARLAKPGMMIGLGAIAKGYAVDRASALLVARGFGNHVVEAGGDTYASGSKGGKPWMVGVQNPGANSDGVRSIGALPSTDVAIVTSGDYQRYFEFEGKRYAHIIDPRTGWPVDQARSPKSVTLVTASATDADAYCTAVAVMGAEAGMAFVESRRDLDAIVITGDDRVLVSSGLREAFIRHDAPSDP